MECVYVTYIPRFGFAGIMSEQNFEQMDEEPKISIVLWPGGYNDKDEFYKKGLYQAGKRNPETGKLMPNFKRRVFSTSQAKAPKQAIPSSQSGMMARSSHLDAPIPKQWRRIVG